jgi:hypothetical protein
LKLDLKVDLVKLHTGKTLEELTRLPTPEEIMERGLKIAVEAGGRREELITLGRSAKQGIVDVSESQRVAHFHITGGIGQGKSKFLERLVRHDIDRLQAELVRGIDPREGRACGLCFLDASEDGDTMNRILAYCDEIGFRKVIVIDPLRQEQFDKTVSINPFDVPPEHWNASINYLVDAFRVVYEVEDISKTSYIKTYLTALFGLFHYAGLTLADLIYFTEPFDKDIEELYKYEGKRQQIYELVRQRINAQDFPGKWRDVAHKHLASVQFAYKNIANFIREAGSSARRLNTIANPDLRLIFGHREGLDFNKLVAEGWVVLVNVDPAVMGDLEARLLGTIVINQVVAALKRTKRHGRTKPYYLYIDEAGDYITYTLADILEKKRKIGLRTVLAHQHLGQLDNAKIRNAIVNCTDIKCAFYVPNQEERTKVFSMLGYGGDLKPEEAAYNLSDQPKQEMVVKLVKKPPVLVKVTDVPDADGDADAFVKKLMQKPWYYTIKEIKEDERDRFKGANPVRSQRTTKSDDGANRRGDSGQVRHGAKVAQKNGRAKKKTRNSNADAKPDMAWESVFLEDDGDEGKAD